MVRLVAFGAAALALLFIAAAIVRHWRERAVYNQLAEHNQVRPHRPKGVSDARPFTGESDPNPCGLGGGAANRTGSLRCYFAEGLDYVVAWLRIVSPEDHGEMIGPHLAAS
jgi:FAD/FMN-containing dehydrogenase